MTKTKENRLVVANRGWGETIPKDILKEVEIERFAFALGLGSNINQVGDAETYLYLYTASLSAPMGHNMTEIYLYLGAKMMKRKGIKELPDFLDEKLRQGLTPDQEREFNKLKRDLYRARGGEIHHPILDAMRQLKKELKI